VLYIQFFYSVTTADYINSTFMGALRVDHDNTARRNYLTHRVHRPTIHSQLTDRDIIENRIYRRRNDVLVSWFTFVELRNACVVDKYIYMAKQICPFSEAYIQTFGPIIICAGNIYVISFVRLSSTGKLPYNFCSLVRRPHGRGICAKADVCGLGGDPSL
jgi:hypothetical protein